MTAAVANFYVPTLSMLYIYGRIFRTIRLRSRNDLGQVTTRRPPQAPAIVSENGDSTSVQNMEMGGDDGGATTDQQRPSNLRREALERGVSAIGRRWKHGGTFKWSKRGPTVSAPQAAAGSTRRDHSSLLDFYQSLTLLELHGASGGVDGAKQSTTHYIDVRVKVEYVVGDVGGQSTNQRQGSEMRHRDVRGPTKSSNSTLSSAGTSGLISQKERKAARQLGVIMCAFIACWLPYFIVFLVVAVCPDCIVDTLFKITLWLGYINSTLNPVLYPLCNANFRRAFAKMLNCRTSPCRGQTYPISGAAPALTTQQSRF